MYIPFNPDSKICIIHKNNKLLFVKEYVSRRQFSWQLKAIFKLNRKILAEKFA